VDYPVLSNAELLSRIRRPTALHDLAVQHYVAPFGGTPGYDITADGHTVRPDAIVSGKAIELERTQKTDLRIFRIYLSYAHILLAKQLEHVEFVFPNERLTGYYRSLFNQTHWPDSVLDVSRKKYVATADPYIVSSDNDVRRLFSFRTESLWLSH
jgi:hypothetical protein